MKSGRLSRNVSNRHQISSILTLGVIGRELNLTVVARTVEEVTTTRGVQVEEDTRNDNDLLLQAGLEEIQTV